MTLREIVQEVRLYPLGVWEELHKITWPTRQRTLQLTLVVFGVVGLSSLVVAGLDAAFSQMMAALLH